MTKLETKLLKENALLKEKIKLLEQTIKLLEQKVDILMRQLYAATSEKLDPAELKLEEPGKPETSSANDAAPEEEKPDDKNKVNGKNKSKNKRKSGGKKKYPKNLTIVIDAVIIPDEVKANPEDWIEIGEEHQDLWDFRPAKYFIKRTINKIFKHRHDKTQPPLQAPMPPTPIAGTKCTPAFAAHLLVAKYCDHLPQYRLAHILETRCGINMPRQKLNRWNTATAQRLRAIQEAIQHETLASGYLQIDETPIRYLVPGHGKTKQGYLWIYNDPSGSVYYDWATGRGHENLIRILGDIDSEHYRGIVQCDGYSAYLTMHDYYKGEITLAACLAHIRRKFYNAQESDYPIVMFVLRLINHLYRIEERLREKKAGPALREAIRSAQSAPIYKRLRKIIEILKPRYLPKHPITQAISYALKHWERQLQHLTNGHVEIDNNLAENAVRPTKLGMKNCRARLAMLKCSPPPPSGCYEIVRWLFFGSAEAGWISACIYTIVENCKRQGLNPQTYIEQVLTHLPQNPTKQEAADLTPLKIAEAACRNKKTA